MIARLVTLLALLAAAAPRQTVVPPAAELVRFDVRVTDASGQPLRDLDPDELEIVEDGAPRPIVLFERIDEPAGNYAEATRLALSAEVSSNRGVPRGHIYLVI